MGLYVGNTRYKPMVNGAKASFMIEGGTPLPYDAEVEYLQSTRSLSQYIDIGINPEVGEVVEISFQNMYSQTSSSSGIFGSRNDSNNSLSLITSSGNFRLYCVTSQSIASQDTGVWHTLVIDTSTNKYVLDNNAPADLPSDYVQTTRPFYLFATNFSTTVTYYGTVRISRFRIGNRLDLIPVRVGSVGYMYDRVSGQLFGNAGTGSFILGNDKNT